MNRVYHSTLNEAETALCDTFRFALISSLRMPVDKAISEIYKKDKNVPEKLSWAAFDTEILKIRQLYGVGGIYEITLKVYPFYQAHNRYGIDEIIVNTDGGLLGYTHILTYPIF